MAEKVFTHVLCKIKWYIVFVNIIQSIIAKMNLKSVHWISLIIVLVKLFRESRQSMVCSNQFAIQPLRLEFFRRPNTKKQTVPSLQELVDKCHYKSEIGVGSSHNYYFSKSSHYLKNARNASSQDSDNLNVFILDFRMVNSDVVYLDFFNYEKILNSKNSENIFF